MRYGLATKRLGCHAIRIGRYYFGFERSTVRLNDQPYLTRYIAYLGPIGMRLHKFWRGDDDRAPHDHPFWFITIPLGTSYDELVYEHRTSEFVWTEHEPWHKYTGEVWIPRLNKVRAWRPHFRPANFKHIVLGSSKCDGRPFWTFCIFGFTQPGWGFWPRPNIFVPFTDWEKYNAAAD